MSVAQQLAPLLLRWFETHRRDLPWRRTRAPYRIWLSEVMLQQTQVTTVIPYYERFLMAFPDVERLAAAPLDEVLRLWAGLGYYSRARNLHRAAQLIVAEHGGEFPRTLAEALALPGLGRYTAGAVLSIAYGERLAALDGNALRVLSRVLWLPGGGRKGEEKRLAEAVGAAAVPVEHPGDYNQAMMELGATVCTPRSPQCDLCPLNGRCAAYRRGQAEAVPVLRRAVSETREVAAGVLWRRGKILIAQRPAQGVWGGLWELPQVEGEGLKEYVERALGLQVEVGAVVRRLKHGIMNRRIALTVYECRVTGGRLRCREHERGEWVRVDELEHYALPAPHRKVAEGLRGE